MKEAVGNAGVVSIAITIIGIIIIIFVSSLNYTKAFKVKNRIVDIIERYNDGYARGNRNKIDSEIASTLRELGYRVDTRNKGCSEKEGANLVYNSSGNYRYCIYENESNRGKYYTVVAFMYLDLPVINELLEFPVSGETKVFYHVIDNHGL